MRVGPAGRRAGRSSGTPQRYPRGRRRIACATPTSGATPTGRCDPGPCPACQPTATLQPGQTTDHEERLILGAVRRAAAQARPRAVAPARWRSPAWPAGRRCRSAVPRRTRYGCSHLGRCRNGRGRRTGRDRGWRSRTASRPGPPPPTGDRRSRRRHRAPTARTSAAARPSGSSPRRPPQGPPRRPRLSAHSSGWVSRARNPLPRVLTVASCPALSRTMTVQTISSSVSRSPDSATCTRAVIRSSCGSRRRCSTSALT